MRLSNSDEVQQHNSLAEFFRLFVREKSLSLFYQFDCFASPPPFLFGCEITSFKKSFLVFLPSHLL